MAQKSQELIQKLLAAEDQAERIIANAREQRTKKLKDVRQAAEEELEPFRKKEDDKFRREQAEQEQSASMTQELDARTQQELGMVKQDYDNNKKNAIKYILDKVLDIDLSLSENVRQSLRA